MIVCLVSSPAALAGWAVMGNHEPDTQEDVDGGFMFIAPHTGAGNQVYFNGFVSASTLNWGSPSPNVDGLGAGKTSAHSVQYTLQAILGVWSDCNGDGYIGFGDQGLFEYRAEVLSNTRTSAQIPLECKPQSARPTEDRDLAAWHNDGSWVRELIPIGWQQGCAHLNGTPDCPGNPPDFERFDINDNSSRVWFDGGFPGDSAAGGGSCSLNPAVGSTHSTGGLLWWLGCGNYGTIDAVGENMTALGLGQLSFSQNNGQPVQDHRYQDSSSPLNQKNPWGEPGADSFVDVWDCSADKTFAPRDPTSPQDGQPGQLRGVQDPTGTPDEPGVLGDGDSSSSNANNINITFDDGYFFHGVNVSGVGTPSPHAGGSVAGTLNATLSGTDKCYRNTDDQNPTRADNVAGFPYSFETDAAGGNSAGADLKKKADGVLYTGYGSNDDLVDNILLGLGITGVRTGGRADQLHGNLFNRVNPQVQPPVQHGLGNATAQALGESTPLQLGTHFASSAGIWHDDIIHFDGALATRWTFYAYVTPQTWLSLPPSGIAGGAYGAEHCANGQPLPGSDGSWACDRSAWWTVPDPSDKTKTLDTSWRSPFLGSDQSLLEKGCRYIGLAADTDATTRGCIQISPYPGDAYNLRDQDCIDVSAAPIRTVGVSTPPVTDPTGQIFSGEFTYTTCPVANENP